MSDNSLDRYFTQRPKARKDPEPRKNPELKPRILEEWLEKNFRKENTKKNYRKAISDFLNCVYGNNEYNSSNVDDGLFLYLHQQRNFTDDLKEMIRKLLSRYMPGTLNVYVNLTRKFFSRQGYEVPDSEWDLIKSSLLPPNIVTTQDETLAKAQLRKVANHLPIQHRALVLFLLSTGCRIGETLQLKVEDLKLEEDPPSANIRPEYTKKGVGGRTVWMSYEARDAIESWLKIKDSMRKRGGTGDYKGSVFPFGYTAAQKSWQRALNQSGFGERDTKTKIYIFHIHTLRKFFRTQMGLAGVSDLIVHAWMGHKAYLSQAYDRPKKELAKIYKDHVGAVSIYLQTVEEEVKQIIVSQKDVPTYLQKGWRFITKLAEDQIIIEGKAGQIIPKEEVKEEEKVKEEQTPPPISSVSEHVQPVIEPSPEVKPVLNSRPAIGVTAAGTGASVVTVEVIPEEKANNKPPILVSEEPPEKPQKGKLGEYFDKYRKSRDSVEPEKKGFLASGASQDWICLLLRPKHPNPEMQQARCEVCKANDFEKWKACQELKQERGIK